MAGTKIDFSHRTLGRIDLRKSFIPAVMKRTQLDGIEAVECFLRRFFDDSPGEREREKNGAEIYRGDHRVLRLSRAPFNYVIYR